MNRLPEVIIKIIVEFASEKFEPKDDFGIIFERNCKNFKDTSLSIYGFEKRNIFTGSQLFMWYYARNCLIHRVLIKDDMMDEEDTFNHLSDDKRELKLFRSPKNPVIKLTIMRNTVTWLYDQDLYNLLIKL